MKQIELICVTAENNNKFYRMEELTGGSWKATWGRVGSTSSEMVYSTSLWNKKYQEKLKKGYKDITTLKAISTDKKGNAVVATNELLMTLQRYAKQKISDEYLVVSESVTLQQVRRAQEILDFISSNKWNKQFQNANSSLMELYTVIPRKMKNVKDHLLTLDSTAIDFKKKIMEEQELLDVMSQQVTMNVTPASSQTKTLEEQLGLTINAVATSDIEEIQKMMGDDKSKYVNAWLVDNKKTREAFELQKKKSHKHWTKLLWHGSRNENWLNIVSTGLLIRPSGVVTTGAMFGNGIYFANKFKKSLGYSSLSGSFWAKGSDKRAFLAIYEVNTGMELRTKTRDSVNGNLTYGKLQAQGKYDSLFAQGGADLINDEFIIYQPSQCTIKYVVEIK